MANCLRTNVDIPVKKLIFSDIMPLRNPPRIELPLMHTDESHDPKFVMRLLSVFINTSNLNGQ